jgi:hypothetical protein
VCTGEGTSEAITYILQTWQQDGIPNISASEVGATIQNPESTIRKDGIPNMIWFTLGGILVNVKVRVSLVVPLIVVDTGVAILGNVCIMPLSKLPRVTENGAALWMWGGSWE